MNISRFAKSIAYLAAAALLLLLSVIFQVGMHSEGGPEASYFRSNTFLFVVAIGCIGTGVYSYIGYVRRHREHALDSLFLLLVGLAVLIASILVFLNFGGLAGTFDKAGYTAVNINIVAPLSHTRPGPGLFHPGGQPRPPPLRAARRPAGHRRFPPFPCHGRNDAHDAV